MDAQTFSFFLSFFSFQGADTTIKNKMGKTPAEGDSFPALSFVSRFLSLLFLHSVLVQSKVNHVEDARKLLRSFDAFDAAEMGEPLVCSPCFVS
jgi:hypothetical protein